MGFSRYISKGTTRTTADISLPSWFEQPKLARSSVQAGQRHTRAGAAKLQASLMIELDAIAAVALGGTPLTGGYGSVVKTIIGALTLTVVRNGLTIAGAPPSWSQIAFGALLIAAIAISLCSHLTHRQVNSDLETMRRQATGLVTFSTELASLP